MTTLTDTFNRPLHDLRISVIDRCNFRCTYCMPQDEVKHYPFLAQEKWLSFDEITRLSEAFVNLGVTKIRLTGGEPLLRPNLDQLIRRLNAISGIEDLALTTNGSLLKENAAKLFSSGLKRLTVSLDTLDARIFKELSGGKGSLKEVLNGIKVAEEEGFGSIKINVVIQRGVNDNSILDLVKYFRGTPHVLRFIEYMDVGNCNHWDWKYVVSSKEIVEQINQTFPLESLERNYLGEVAERYRFKDGAGEIGFISSVSQPFCQDCTRARVSTDGKLFTCLFSETGHDLMPYLHQNLSTQELSQKIQALWQNRSDRYSELRAQLPRPSHKVEMFQIGG